MLVISIITFTQYVKGVNVLKGVLDLFLFFLPLLKVVFFHFVLNMSFILFLDNLC